LGHDGLVENRDVGRDVPDPLVQLDRVDGLAAEVPDRYVHHASARFLSITRPPRGPGTAPFTATRFFSGSTRTTCRFLTVTRSLPMWPAIRMPLMTRPGVVPEPIEPGARQRSDWPWVFGPPWKPCRFMTPAKPLPLLVAVTST